MALPQQTFVDRYRQTFEKVASAPPRDLAPLSVVPQQRGLFSEFVSGAKSALGGIPGGAGLLASDVELTEPENALQQYGQAVQQANAPSAPGWAGLRDHPLTAASGILGSAAGSTLGGVGAKVLGTGLMSAAAYTGPVFGSILFGTGAALRYAGPLASFILPSASSIYSGQKENAPERVDTPGAKLARWGGGALVGMLEKSGGAEAIALGTIARSGVSQAVAKATGSQMLGRAAYMGMQGAKTELKENLAQSPIEQLASFENPLSAKSLSDTAYGAVAGIIGGGGLGAAIGALPQAKPVTPPGDVSNDALKGAVDGATAPTPAPAPAPTPAPESMAQTARAGLNQEQRVDLALRTPAGPAPAAAPAPAPESMAQTALAGLDQEQRVDLALRTPAGPAPAAAPAPAPESMAQTFGAPALDVTPLQAVLASNPTAVPKGASPTLKKVLAELDTAQTPEELAAKASEIHFRESVARRGKTEPQWLSGYTDGRPGVLAGIYTAATGGQSLPSVDEYVAQQIAQAQAADAAAVQPPQVAPIPQAPEAVQPPQVAPIPQAPEAVQPPQVASIPQAPEAVQPPQVASIPQAPEAVQTPQAALPQGTQPELGVPDNIPPAPRLTKGQTAVRQRAMDAIAEAREAAQKADDAMLDNPTPATQRRAEVAAARVEKMQADFEAKYRPQMSRQTGAAGAVGQTVAAVRKFVEDRLGREVFAKLRKRFVIVQDTAALQAEMTRRGSQYTAHVDDTTKGLYDPSTQTSYIVAGNLSATDSPWGVFLHEVGVHYGLKSMLGGKAYAAVLRDVNRLLRSADAALLAAARQVNQAEQLGLDENAPDFGTQFADRLLGNPRLAEEAVAYLAENPANHNRSLWKRIVGAVRNFLRSIGISRPVTTDDIVALVLASARKAADTAAPMSDSTMVSDAKDVLREFGYTAVTNPDGTVDIRDVNGTVIPDEDIAPSAQLAAAIAKYPAMRAELGLDVRQTGPLFSRTTATGPTSLDTDQTLNDFGKAVNTARAFAGSVLSRMTRDSRDSFTAKMLRIAVKWADRQHLVEMYDDMFGGALSRNAETYANQEVIASRFNQMFNNPYQKLEALERSSPGVYKDITKLMTATELQLDPRKSWKDHTHLHTLDAADQALVKQHLNDFAQVWGRLTAEQRQIYTDLADMNEMMYLADMVVSLQNIARANIPEGMLPQALRGDITEGFRNRPETHESIAAAKTYWGNALTAYTAAIETYAAQQRSTLPTVEPQTPAQREVVRHLSPLEAQLEIIKEGLKGLAKAPYFHLGRFGDYFVGAKVRVTEDGKVDVAAMRHVAEVLGDKFPDVSIRGDSTDPAIIARFESVEAAQTFQDMMEQLGRDGFLQQDEKGASTVAGVRSQVQSKAINPEWLNRAIESIRAEDYATDDSPEGLQEGRRIADRLIANLRSTYLESLPDLSTAKVLAHRVGRQGFSADMVRSYAHRMRVASNHIAGTAVEPQRRASMQQIRAAQFALQTDPNVSLDEKNKMGIIADSFRQREIDLQDIPQTPGLSMLRSLGHAFYLGMSPAYTLLSMSQLGALAWPEFTKRHGAVKAFNAMVKVTPTAFKVIRGAVTMGFKARGLKGAADAVITSDVLRAMGLSAEDTTFLVEMMGTGKLDIGNATRNLARLAEGEIEGPNSVRASEIIRLATATSYMSEIFTRLVVALAAKELHGNKPGAIPYAVSVLDNAMFNFGYSNLAPATGKRGVFSVFTPVVFQFHQYQFQALGKLYREIYRAVGLDKSGTVDAQAQRRKEAQVFLKAHVAAMTLLAGTMGLPFMTVAARVGDMLCEMFSDQPCDTKASLRNFTADIVGPDVEPLISRGVLRVLGGDISSRAGEGDLFPWSGFLADRRTLTEKLKSPLISVSGATGGMFSSIIEGMGLMADGDWLGGVQKAMPLAIQGPIKAYKLGTQGFTDRSQNKLPMTPHASEILMQILGVQPGQAADYSQAARAQTQRAGILSREATLIRRNLAIAIERGDRAEMVKWAREAEAYQRANPGLQVMAGVGSTLQQRSRARALSSVGVLPGTNVRDAGAREFTRYFQPEAQ